MCNKCDFVDHVPWQIPKDAKERLRAAENQDYLEYWGCIFFVKSGIFQPKRRVKGTRKVNIDTLNFNSCIKQLSIPLSSYNIHCTIMTKVCLSSQCLYLFNRFSKNSDYILQPKLFFNWAVMNSVQNLFFLSFFLLR